MPNLPPKFTKWPEQHPVLDTPDKVQLAYERGWQGCFKDPAAEERVRQLTKDTSGYADLDAAAHDQAWADSGAGKLVVPFLFVRKLWPNAYPGEAQQTGCCVSMSTRNALTLTIACELSTGKPDPDTGMMEGVPDVPPDGEKAGVFSNAPNYWTRGYNGDGWSCSTSAENAVNKIGLAVAKPYPELGCDLTHCNAHNDHLYGSREPPEDWMKVFGAHKVRSAAEVTSFEQCRDLLFNGYGITTCGGEAWTSTRNEDGVSTRRGSWSHALAMLGADDRDVIKAKYNEPLVWIQNSWANWNSGPLRILGTIIDANPGGFWTTWSSVQRRDMYAFSNLAGWPARKLDWNIF